MEAWTHLAGWTLGIRSTGSCRQWRRSLLIRPALKGLASIRKRRLIAYWPLQLRLSSSLMFLRDRVGCVWQTVRDHLYHLCVQAQDFCFLVERAVVGLLRLAIRLLRREEISGQVSRVQLGG